MTTQPTPEAYEAGRSAYDRIVIANGSIGYRKGHYEASRASVDAVWPLAYAAGRQAAAAEIRAGTAPGKQMPSNMLHAPWWSSLSGPYPAGFAEWAARIAEGTAADV